MPKFHDYIKMFNLTKIGVANHAKNTPDKPALIMEDRVITYKEMDELTNAMGHVLIDMGIKQGDRLCIQAYNSPGMPLFTAAAGKAACIPIRLAPARSLKGSSDATMTDSAGTPMSSNTC